MINILLIVIRCCELSKVRVCAVIKMIVDVELNRSLFCVFFSAAEEEYKRLSEALADEGTYNAVAFKYSADYYDPSQPTEEEDANRETGKNQHTHLPKQSHSNTKYCRYGVMGGSHFCNSTKKHRK